MNRIISPEVILQKICDRLKTKIGDLEYLFYLDKGFEKWLQYELVLSMSDLLVPVVYDREFNEIKLNREHTGEKICDIAAEYSIEGDLRSDVAIAESPFLNELINEDSWILKNRDYANKCRSKYRESKFHYIELKHRKWLHVADAVEKIADTIATDLKKYTSTLDWRSFRPHYKPSSIVAICCISLWNPEQSNKTVSKRKILETFEKSGEMVCRNCDKDYGTRGTVLYQILTDEIGVLMVYYKL